LSSFRCSRFGVTCDVGGATSDEMNVSGLKEGCHSNEQSAYLDPVAPIARFVRGLKANPRQASSPRSPAIRPRSRSSCAVLPPVVQ
jgi:hypothetical protein